VRCGRRHPSLSLKGMVLHPQCPMKNGSCLQNNDYFVGSPLMLNCACGRETHFPLRLTPGVSAGTPKNRLMGCSALARDGMLVRHNKSIFHLRDSFCSTNCFLTGFAGLSSDIVALLR
jgi:hypothetical protein